METVANYWIILKLTSDGHYQPAIQVSAQTFFQTAFPTPPDDDRIQADLLAHPQPEAQLCLRCFISHGIVQACHSLVHQFGTLHQFRLRDILCLVLDDDGTLRPNPYQPLSLTILRSFQPSASSLTTWTIRHVRQHPDIKQFLLEHGVYLISHWALLNDTKPDRLPPILSEFHRLSSKEVDRACLLLESYRHIYLPDRLQQRLKEGNRKPCAPPTPEQLQRISAFMQAKTGIAIAPEAILQQLKTLAQQLRHYRIARRSGKPPTQSLDDPEIQDRLEYRLTVGNAEPVDNDHTTLLQHYRASFQQSLQDSVAQVIDDRLRKARSAQQRQRFLTALHAYYCQQQTMGEIATQIGLSGQDGVSRLLKLKDLRADVRYQMLMQLKASVLAQATQFVDPQPLRDLDQEIEQALNEQLETLMQAEAQRDKTPKGLKKAETRFAHSLCLYLDALLAQRPT
jgi:hypothetical protein